MLTFKQLTHALAVERTLHFKKAANHCAVSQSALSASIHELESQLGSPLFERNNKHVMLTSFGRVFLQRARQVVLAAEDLMAFAQAQREPLSYPLSIGVIPTIGPFLLPKVLPHVREAYPNVSLRLVEEQSHRLVQQVRDGELDTAIVALPYPLEGLHAFEFWDENFFVVMHHSEVDTDATRIRADELAVERLLLLREGHCLKDHALSACRLQMSAKQDTSLESTSLYTLVQMVAGKMGLTLVPELALEQLVTSESGLVALALAEPGPHRSLAFITRLNYVGVDGVERLRVCFREALMNAPAH
ncbi:MAG: LysR substrate-binding domain-containing protein [Gammaproteobacteria bacterium]